MSAITPGSMAGRQYSITFDVEVLWMGRGMGWKEVLLELAEKLVRVGKW